MKIDRNNIEDVLKQIGRTENQIQNLNSQVGNIDKILNGWNRRKMHLKNQKQMIVDKISRHQKYINELENDLKS